MHMTCCEFLVLQESFGRLEGGPGTMSDLAVQSMSLVDKFVLTLLDEEAATSGSSWMELERRGILSDALAHVQDSGCRRLRNKSPIVGLWISVSLD